MNDASQGIAGGSRPGYCNLGLDPITNSSDLVAVSCDPGRRPYWG